MEKNVYNTEYRESQGAPLRRPQHSISRFFRRKKSSTGLAPLSIFSAPQ